MLSGRLEAEGVASHEGAHSSVGTWRGKDVVDEAVVAARAAVFLPLGESPVEGDRIQHSGDARCGFEEGC